VSILVGRKAPDFTAAAVLANGEIVNEYKLSSVIKNKYALIFFYPLDFTFVCPSELIALHKRISKFKELGIEVIGVSIDSHFSHNAWREVPIDKGGIGKLDFTLVGDINHNICQSYGVEHPDVGVAFRAAFIIDNNGIVRSQIVNDLPIGRDIDEILRTFAALQHHERHGEVCPAGWNDGDAAMQATPAGVASYLAEHSGNL
jgi:peroxiredoxin 2/4